MSKDGRIVFKETVKNEGGTLTNKHDIISWSGELIAGSDILSEEGRILGEFGINSLSGKIYASGDIMSWKGSISSVDDIESRDGEIYADKKIETLYGLIAHKITADEVRASFVSCYWLKGNKKLRPNIEITRNPGYEISCYVGSDIGSLFPPRKLYEKESEKA